MGKPWNNESRVSREVVGMRPPCAPYDSAPEGARSEREGAPHDLKNQDAVDPTRHATESAAVDPLLNPSLTRTLLLRLSLYTVCGLVHREFPSFSRQRVRWPLSLAHVSRSLFYPLFRALHVRVF